MICPKCGANIPDSSKFCTSCGTKVEIPQPQTTRSSAGASVPGGSSVSGGTPNEAYVQGLIIKKRVSAYLALGGGIYGMVFALLFMILSIVYFASAGAASSYYGYYAYAYGYAYYTSGAFIAAAIVMLILCGLNIVGGILNFRFMSETLAYVRAIQRNPSGIVQYHQSQDRSTAHLLLSIFFGLNAPGIASGIVAIVARNTVLQNKDKF